MLAAVLLVFAACGSDDGDDTTGGGDDETEAPADDEPSFETLSEGVLTVGSCLDYKPFEFVKDGEEMGFDVELTEAIAEKLGLEVEWVTANFDTIFTSVAAGQFDMVAAASTITEERLQTVDFSDPYFNSRQGLTVDTDYADIASIGRSGGGRRRGRPEGNHG